LATLSTQSSTVMRDGSTSFSETVPVYITPTMQEK
jgi:hypothetical protein